MSEYVQGMNEDLASTIGRIMNEDLKTKEGEELLPCPFCGATPVRNEVMGTRVTQPERRLIEAAAEDCHTSVSDFIRAASVKAARESLHPLAAGQSRVVVQQVGNGGAPTPFDLDAWGDPFGNEEEGRSADASATQKLLEAKDAAVRAKLAKDDGA